MAAAFGGKETFGRVDFVMGANVVSREEKLSLCSALPEAPLPKGLLANGPLPTKSGRHFQNSEPQSQQKRLLIAVAASLAPTRDR
jgi:hypothetical protein